MNNRWDQLVRTVPVDLSKPHIQCFLGCFGSRPIGRKGLLPDLLQTAAGSPDTRIMHISFVISRFDFIE